MAAQVLMRIVPKPTDPALVARRRMRHLMSLGRPVKILNHAMPSSPSLEIPDDMRQKLQRIAGASLYIHIQNATQR